MDQDVKLDGKCLLTNKSAQEKNELQLQGLVFVVDLSSTDADISKFCSKPLLVEDKGGKKTLQAHACLETDLNPSFLLGGC